jgi:hypothetical protein
LKYLALAFLAVSCAAPAEPLTVDHGRLFIPVTLSGMPTEALLDSGAEGTIVDPVLAAKAKLPTGEPVKIKGSGGEQDARLVPGVAVTALGIELHPEAIVVLDLAELTKRLVKRPTSMILGREMFDSARLQIDIAGGAISAVPSAPTPPGQRLELTAHAGIESVPVTVNGKSAQADFDLGNGSDVMVSRALVERLGLKITGKKAGGGIGGELQRDTVLLDRLELAGKTFQNVPASIDDQASANDVNVGTSILKNFVITTDFKQRAVWLQPK